MEHYKKKIMKKVRRKRKRHTCVNTGSLPERILARRGIFDIRDEGLNAARE